ncbi:hypothetical protein D5086_018406 [Populus alba]|uniref:Uncharacterized protein n=1 Tax=Populus alba TaxID=43335 RepID=A0ACC4BQ77_POPAL
MIKSLLLRSFPSPLLIEARDVNRSSKRVVSSTITCSSSRSDDALNIPKLDPFSRTKIERAVKSLPLIQKSENELADYCSTLEGDDSYSCWRAYFELKDLEVASWEVPSARKSVCNIQYALTSVCPKKMEYREQCHSKIALATHLMQTIGLCSCLSYRYCVNLAFFPNPNSLSSAQRKVRSQNIAFHDSTWRNRALWRVLILTVLDIAGYLPAELGLLTDVALFHINSKHGFCGNHPQELFPKLTLINEFDVSNNRFVW